VLYLPYDTLVAAFAAEGIDIQFNESTPDPVFRNCIKAIESVAPSKMQSIKNHLIAANQQEIDVFMVSLTERLDRMVEKVVIIPLYGRSAELATIADALRFLDQHHIYEGSGEFRKYEVLISFSNGDHVEGSFKDKAKVRDFLQFIAKQ
jgi:hypothetical protein